MARLKTFSDGGVILPTDLNNMEDDYECAFGTYKETILIGSLNLLGATSGMHLFNSGGNLGQPASLFYLDPALYWTDAATEANNPRTAYYNLAIWGDTNGTAPGTLTFGLYTVTATGSGNPYPLTTSGSATTGSTVTLSSLATNSPFIAYSGDFAAPAAGYYAVGGSNTTLSGSNTTFVARLLVRQV